MDPNATTSDITVTSATQAEDAVRERHEPKPEPATPPAEPTPAPAPVADPEAAELEKALDAIEPPAKADETPEERTERRSRAEKRIAKLTGRAKTAEERADAAERRAKELEEQLRSQAKPPAPAPAAPAPAEKPADGSATASAKADDAPKFEFPTYEQWQEAHPDGEYTDYQDERTDARYAWNRRVEAEKAQRDAEATARLEKVRAATKAVESFKAEHPDYDEKVRSFEIPGLELDADGRIVSAPPTYEPVKDLLTREGENAPAILYYLATHHEDAKALMGAESLPALLVEWGAIKRLALAPSQPAAKAEEPAAKPAPPPAKPSTSSPAPVTPVPASAVPTPTLHSLAADDEDADAYIAARTQQRRAAGVR